MVCSCAPLVKCFQMDFIFWWTSKLNSKLMENEAELQYLADYLARRGQTPSSPAWEGGNIMDICRERSEDGRVSPLVFISLQPKYRREREQPSVSHSWGDDSWDSGDRQEESRSRWWDKPRAAWLSMFIQFSIIYATVVRIWSEYWGRGRMAGVGRFEWSLSAQVTMGAGVAHLGCHLDRDVSHHKAGNEGTHWPLNLDPFTSD